RRLRREAVQRPRADRPDARDLTPRRHGSRAEPLRLDLQGPPSRSGGVPRVQRRRRARPHEQGVRAPAHASDAARHAGTPRRGGARDLEHVARRERQDFRRAHERPAQEAGRRRAQAGLHRNRAQRRLPSRDGARMSLRKNLVVAFVLFAFGLLTVTLVPFGVVSVHGHLRSFVDAESLDTQHTASAVARTTEPSRSLLEHYEGQADAAWLLDASGSTLAAPTNRQAFPALVTSAPEVESARRGATGTRIADTPDGRRLLIASPTFKAGRLSGVLWASISLAPVRREDRETWAQLAAIGAVVMIIAAMVGVFLSRRIARRLEIVAAGAKRFGEGHLEETITVGGSDEITSLAGTLNTMGAEIDRLVHREKDFVAAASHQIRTPLTAIKIRIDELLATSGTHDAEETEYLKEMAEEVDRLTMLTTR